MPQETKTLKELEDELEAMGYDLEELDRDNPYNQWMYEDE